MPDSQQTPDITAVRDYLKSLQATVCATLEVLDSETKFIEDSWVRDEGGGGVARVLTNGGLFEQAGVNFSHVTGASLPPSATQSRPELKGRAFEAMGVSLVLHPDNPYIPTTHANVRFFTTTSDEGPPVWWFGGGFDLTPYYPFEEDCIHWHQCAKSACDPFGDTLYSELKDWCDRYFYLKHRDEARGVGGLFFDDHNQPDFQTAFDLMQSVGNHFLMAYVPIAEKRRELPFGEREKSFQRYRRGRYVEFNLVYDRGTLFGLQSGGRTESILMSLPPSVEWRYNWQPEPGTPESLLYTDFLPPRDWLAP